MLSAALVALVLALSAPPAAAEAAPPAPSFGACEPLMAARPEAEETAKCIEEAGEALKRTEDAAVQLRALLQRHPGSPWPTLYLAFVDTAHAGELFRSAASGFAARREAKGEVLARANLQRLLYNAGHVDEAGAEVERVVRVAEASGQQDLIARASVLKARHLWAVGKDLEQAYLLLRQAEAVLFPNGGTYYMKRDCLSGLANLSLELGRRREGLEAFRRMADLAVAEGDGFAEASARYGMARAVLDGVAELPSESGRREAARLAQQALDAAIASNNRGVQVRAHLTLGVVSHGEEARKHFEACLDAADSPRDQSYCLNALARLKASSDTRAAEGLVAYSLALAHKAEDYWSMAYAWRERMRVSWMAGRHAVEDSWSALNAIEALRDAQAATSASQAQAFSTWSEDYYWLSGRLIQSAEGGGGEADLDRAFQVAERLRSRSLVDTLEAAHAVPEAAAPIRQRRGTVLEQISGVQRRLMDPDLPAAERPAALHELETLEMQEAGLRNQLASAAPALASPRRPDFATLSRVRRALADDEALLSFQVASWEDERGDFAGGSWLLVATRGGSRVYRLPGRGELRSALRLFGGLFDRRDGAEARAAVALYNQLLARPLADLPPGVRRLLVIPDDALHQLPFGALRSAPEAPPLATRFALTEIPSATLWLGWREERPGIAAVPALALADPPLPGGASGTAARERAAVFASGVRLGPLPYARRESRSVVWEMGGGSVRRLGADASEAWLKSAPLGRYGILHFATHAVTDEANPDRSGVLLAPGAKNQDGLLQIREIVDLNLGGRVVVLSACSSNTGVLLRGEGVMSLARAFFQAGAHTVVASLWRLRDDEAADFFDRFYGHLGRGLSVAVAAQAAQKDMIADGAPAAAWAGIVVLGDGDVVPLPGGRKGWRVPEGAWWAVGLVAAGVALAGWAWRRGR